MCAQHPDGHVVRNGRYGDPPRQLWLCTPANSSSKHSFAGPLPQRVLPSGHTCGSCEADLAPHQGPRSPRAYSFPVREAAAALVAVGSGLTYTEAAQAARARAGRRPVAVGLGAQLVGNWVEVLAPVVAAAHHEVAWPETIVCDSTSFFVTNTRTGYRSLAFNVLAVWGYPAGRRKGRLWALSASHQATNVEWSELLERLPGTPRLVVADHDRAIHAAVANHWPLNGLPPRNWSPVQSEPFVKWCEHHLHELARGHLRTYGRDQDRTARQLLHEAFRSPHGWDAFRAYAAQLVQLDHWCSGAESWVRPQASRRTQLPDHHANGAVEQSLQQVIALIGRRAYSFRNRHRTNQLLELARLRINGVADEVTYAAAIRDHLNSGGTLGGQLNCADHGTKPQHRGQQVSPASLRQ